MATSDEPGPAAVGASDRLPALPRGRPSREEIIRRMLLMGAVLFAIGLFVMAGMLADTDASDEAGVSGDIVERLIPARDEEALRQTPVGIDLDEGWGLGRLSINGVDTREDEWEVTAGLGLYQFRPGEGKTVELLEADRNCARAEIFQLVDPTNSRAIDWCFTAS